VEGPDWRILYLKIFVSQSKDCEAVLKTENCQYWRPDSKTMMPSFFEFSLRNAKSAFEPEMGGRGTEKEEKAEGKQGHQGEMEMRVITGMYLQRYRCIGKRLACGKWKIWPSGFGAFGML